MATADEDLNASDEMKDSESTLSSGEDLTDSDENEESQPSISGLNCPLCLMVFRCPRRLPCFHSFCQDCLESHISNTASAQGTLKQICCPICENLAWSGEYSTDKLVHAFPLNTFVLSILTKSELVGLQCNACQAEEVFSTAEYLCTVCEEALCGQCSKTHRSPRLSATHTILKIEDLPSKQETVLQNNVMFHCVSHAYFPIEYYCKGHDIQLCAKCIIASHKNCSEVIELTSDTLNLSDTLNHTKEHMRKLEAKLKKAAVISALNLSKLETETETEVNNITECIWGVKKILKKMIKYALNDLQKRVEKKYNKIIKETKMRSKQFKYNSQSHLAAIRNSKAILELASKCATQTQMFLLTKNIMNQLSLSQRHIEDKYSENDILSLELYLDPQLISIYKILRGEKGRLREKRNDQILDATDGFKPLKEFLVELLCEMYEKTPSETDLDLTKMVESLTKLAGKIR